MWSDPSHKTGPYEQIPFLFFPFVFRNEAYCITCCTYTCLIFNVLFGNVCTVGKNIVSTFNFEACSVVDRHRVDADPDPAKLY